MESTPCPSTRQNVLKYDPDWQAELRTGMESEEWSVYNQTVEEPAQEGAWRWSVHI
ncbi:hypothetical protein A2U01_0062642 [Trifolium medium]|uniref:Uncharacterized protein n=1 Tax=Trifolium medium TaxID=97028 RepID=A0A392RYD4_9FABA|nr:hypothetical protein [Trifolium medium]